MALVTKREIKRLKIKATKQSGGKDRQQVHRSLKPEANIPTEITWASQKRSPRMAFRTGEPPAPHWECKLQNEIYTVKILEFTV